MAVKGTRGMVFVIASKEASFALPVEYVPVDAAVDEMIARIKVVAGS